MEEEFFSTTEDTSPKPEGSSSSPRFGKKKIVLAVGLAALLLGALVIFFVVRFWGGEEGERPAPQPERTAPAVSAEGSGCVFSLRFDADLENPDPALKNAAKEELEKIRRELESGTGAEEILSKLSGPGVEDIAAYLESRRGEGPVPTIPENPYKKFRIEDAINFCFGNLEERDEELGRFFYESNPGFKEKRGKLGSGEASEPFLIKKSSSQGIIDYAWALIYKKK